MMPGPFRKTLRILLVTAMAVAPLVATAQTEAAPASSPAPSPVTGPASAPASAQFDVADVHASPYVRFPFMDGGNLSGDRYILHQATMTQIIAAAYNLDPTNVQGGPSWLDWDHFDIVAKAPPTTSKPAIRLMLESLLSQRFSLVVHTDSAPMPAFVLSAQTGKTKLKDSETKESGGTGEPNCQYQPPTG